MFCSKCGSPNDDAARFCGKCGSGLPAAMAASAGAADAPPAPSMPPPPAMPQGYADPRVRGGAAPGPVYGQPGAMPAQGKNPLVAVLLSFFIPGAGQMYNDQVQKGALMLGGYILSWFLVLLVIGFFGVVGIWLWSMIDAYKVADATRAYARPY